MSMLTRMRKYPIKFEDLNPANRTIEVSGNNSRNDNNTLKLEMVGVVMRMLSLPLCQLLWVVPSSLMMVENS